MDLLFERESYAIIGAAQEIHKIFGCGFLEAVYQEALSLEFNKRNIPFIKEKELTIKYKDLVLSKSYVADLVCFDMIIVEIKALSQLTKDHESQVLNYLKATDFKLGYYSILVKFHKLIKLNIIGVIKEFDCELINRYSYKILNKCV